MAKRAARTTTHTSSSPPPRHPSRVVIEHVRPQIDCGRFAIKRTVNETVVVTADVYTDGHDLVTPVLRFKTRAGATWQEVPMTLLGNDGWQGSFAVTSLEPWTYTVEAWIDHFKTWRQGLVKKSDAGKVERVDLLIGAALVSTAAVRAKKDDARRLKEAARTLEKASADAVATGLDESLALLMTMHPDRRDAAKFPRELVVQVDRERARFSAWYELFPRSCSPEPGRHGTLEDCEARLPYVAGMGFDVVYLPPIHPIGETFRKGPNNNPVSEPGDLGSPWAIGSAAGGHKAVHPDLGTVDDVRSIVTAARELGMEIALDYALQCAPDHPYVTAHPQWFRWRPDGTIQYAENPPKKYQDIYPILFETDDWQALWEELKSVLLFWIDVGVRIFRVDNPHTKPFAFWEWVIAEIRRDHPDVLFLAEAFTRPKVMYQLAKLGFTQSYTYFAWRNNKQELTEYFTELTQSPVHDFFRPNLWPNTPDILTEALQYGGRATFMHRAALAATLGASYGIYGPAFELGDHVALREGSEEYLNSEKYQIRAWDLDRPGSLGPYLARLNWIRRDNLALHSNERLQFHAVDNDQLIAYTKTTPDLANVVLVVVNLDPHHVQSGWIDLPLDALGLPTDGPFQAHDLLTGEHYFWSGRRNFVQLDPARVPAHVLVLHHKVRTEQDVDFFR